MPKITTIGRLIADSRYKLDIWYNTSELFHIKAGLPDDMVTFCDAYNALAHCPTQAGVESKLDGLISKFNTAGTTERKIILVRSNLSAGSIEALKLPYDHPLHKNHFSSELPTFGFDLVYIVLTERTIGNKKSWHTEKGGKFRDVHSSEMVLDYTVERENFFKRLVEAVLQIGANMAEFFVKDPLLLADKIDNGHKLLG